MEIACPGFWRGSTASFQAARQLNEDPFVNYRLELGYLGISHRQAVISQSSAARHQHLLRQFLSAQDTTRTGLHIINTGVLHSPDGINSWLVAGAALESRAHPFFRINPEAGNSFAETDFKKSRVNGKVN